MERLFDEVARTYLDTKSIHQTSLRHQISRTKVRKILIGMGLLDGPLAQAIQEGIKQGKDKKTLCQELCISAATYNDNVGYSKCCYHGESRSKQALRSERFHVREALYKRCNANLKEEGKTHAKRLFDSSKTK